MHAIESLLQLMAKLRDPVSGCPWDRQQTYASIVPYTLEEAYEVADAIEREDWDELRLELGDLLFQVVFYAQIAREEGRFDFNQVVEGIVDKMERRHPHVFGEAQVADAQAQTHAWERHKQAEREAKGRVGEEGILAAIPLNLPAMVRAQKMTRKAAKVGFDWPDLHGVLDKIEEEIQEVRAELAEGQTRQRLADEIGDLLFACVNLARMADVDAESAVRGTNRRFQQRFEFIEAELARQGRSPAQATLEEMDQLWDQAKLQGL